MPEQNGTSVTTEYTLTGSPVDVLFGGPVTLLVGLEDEPDGSLRVYLGSRYKGVYLRVCAGDPEQEKFRRAWASGGHVWMRPVPPPELLHHDGASVSSPSVTTDKRRPDEPADPERG